MVVDPNGTDNDFKWRNTSLHTVRLACNGWQPCMTMRKLQINREKPSVVSKHEVDVALIVVICEIHGP